MIQSYLKQIFFIVLILISFQNSKQDTVFTVEGLRIYNVPCGESTFIFNIDGTFDDYSKANNNFVLNNMETSKGQKLMATCYPSRHTRDTFACAIDKNQYPLNNVNITVPTTPPDIVGYTFKNWEKTIGYKPGYSNKLYHITCLNKEENTFVPSSITVEDCTFIINGNWENENSINLYSFSQIEIVVDNEKKDIAICNYKNQLMRFECEFEGDGPIKIKDQYLTYSNNVYKIKGIDSGKTVNCSIDDFFDDEIKSVLSGSFFDLNNILILISLLLF